MSSSLLDPSVLVTSLPKLLPSGKERLNSPQDAIAALLHTAMSSLDFRLIGVDDTNSIGTFEQNRLPEAWNTHGPGSYTFRYKHSQSSLEFLLKISKLGSRTVINAIALETDKASSLDVSTNDFTSPSFFPHDLSTPDPPPLVHGYISSNRITDLISQFQNVVIQKFIPGLHKHGYTESSQASSSSQMLPDRPRNPESSWPPPMTPPVVPRHSNPPGFHPGNPLAVGSNDRSPPFPRSLFEPPPLFPDNGGSGMFVGPDHPMFRRGGHSPGNIGPFGGDGFLPPMGAPPGARYDPIVPGPFGRPPRNWPQGPRTGEPDNDEFMPPGAGDMFM